MTSLVTPDDQFGKTYIAAGEITQGRGERVGREGARTVGEASRGCEVVVEALEVFRVVEVFERARAERGAS